MKSCEGIFEKANELKSLMIKYIEDGRSTLGKPQ